MHTFLALAPILTVFVLLVVMRLSAFILLCIGFEIMWTGLSVLIEELK